MMSGLIRRAERLAAAEQRRQVRRLAALMKDMLGAGSVEADDAAVVATGRGLFKRWLVDPGLRFLSSGLR